ncbi:glycolipid transfer protein 3-like isoform X1 [Diospyros lotus]|uniref:glycolipid transfer protein 3-like isoform X1 n=1 Tax=Diospyros lotus TaxID=55363 RepID=UPI0022506BE0|nr:glycolipid transfer protein 3-like isoform X1 [Diospyros lotus]
MKRREMEKGSESEIRSAIEELSMAVAKANKPADATGDHVLDDDAAHVPTKPFLYVCSLLLQVLDKIGPTMAVLRQDMDQNIQRLEKVHESDPSMYSNLVEILKKEAAEGNARKSNSCSRGFVWLTRSLDFTVALLQLLVKDSERNMDEAVEEAYDVALRPWHGWISSAAYKVALKLVPDNKTLINILKAKDEEGVDGLKEEMRSLISLLVPLLEQNHSILSSHGLDRLKAT